jgi:hypothetical protein
MTWLRGYLSGVAHSVFAAVAEGFGRHDDINGEPGSLCDLISIQTQL